MVRAGLLVLALAGCGRLAFDPVDEGAGDGASGAPCAFDLCEGFEASAIDTSVWRVESTVARDTAIARSGRASARIHVDALAPSQAASASLAESRTLAVSKEMWVRGWFRMSALPAGTNEVELIGLAPGAAADANTLVLARADRVGFDLPFTGISATTMLVLPVDAWFCLVWHVRLATSGGGAMDLTGDLFEGGSITGGQTDTQPPASVLRFGVRWAAANVTVAQPALDVWLDDLIVHSAPVTCEN